MNAVVLITLNLSLVRVIGVSSVGIPSVLLDTCRFTNFCTQNASSFLNDSGADPCCLPCSCSVKCGLVDRCCPDVEIVHETSAVYSCRDLLHVSILYQNASFWPYEAPLQSPYSYHVIDGCPSKILTQSEFSESVSNCYSVREIDDLRFVTSAFSGLTYLNKHCAICNQEVAFTEWKLHSKKADLITSASGYEERFRGILKNRVYPMPPSREVHLNSLCVPIKSTIFSCNERGLWDYYDRDIEEKCSEIKVMYRADRNSNYRSSQEYANVYCFLCNSPKSRIAHAQCKKIEINTQMLGIKQLGGDKNAFSALLVAKPSVAEATVCGIGEIRDHFRMMCRDLHCPVMTLAQNGLCTSISDYVIDYVVGINIEFSFESRVSRLPKGFESDLYIFFTRNLNNSCDVCRFEVYADSFGGVMEAMTITTEHCSVINMLESLYVFVANTTVKVYFPTVKTYIILANYKHEANPSKKPLTSRKAETKRACEEMDHLFSRKTVYCPSLILTSEDMQDFSSRTDVTTKILSNSISIGNHAYRICLRDYFLIVDEKQIKLRNTSQDDHIMTRVLPLAFLQIVSFGFARKERWDN